MPLALKVIAHGSPEYQETIALRLQILRYPLGLTLSPEDLAAETQDIHIGAWECGVLVGCLILTPLSSQIVKMRQVAVATERQGDGIGKRLVSFAELEAQQRGYEEIVLHARENVMAFYLKQGYHTEGERFIEVTLPHFAMRKRLLAPNS